MSHTWLLTIAFVSWLVFLNGLWRLNRLADKLNRKHNDEVTKAWIAKRQAMEDESK